MVVDYDKVRQGQWSLRSRVTLPEKEVYFPEGEPVFPLANAQRIAIENMSPLQPPDDSGVDRQFRIELPGDEEEPAPGVPDLEPHLERHRSHFNITAKRIMDYGESPDCPGCRTLKGVHTAECRERFEELLRRDGKLPPIVIVLSLIHI